MKLMNKWRKILNERGFTLIEMMIVMLVISVLLIITVPSIVKNQEAVNKKGCEAYIKMVEGHNIPGSQHDRQAAKHKDSLQQRKPMLSTHQV